MGQEIDHSQRKKIRNFISHVLKIVESNFAGAAGVGIKQCSLLPGIMFSCSQADLDNLARL